MKKIVLNVSDENVETVMSILNNLKAGLIDNIEAEGGRVTRRAVYVPKSEKAIPENKNPLGKYLSPSLYRNKIKKSK